MRSSKQRQRNKQNRNSRPSGGNVVNRVFDSSGPEGKVRGTPAQIIEKYLQLHRDAQLAGDRVNAENFAQHAEHYTRMLAEAQREIDKVREEQDQWNRDRQAERDRQMEQARERGQGGQQEGRGQEGRGQDGRSQDGRSQDGRPQEPRGDRDQPRERSWEPRGDRGTDRGPERANDRPNDRAGESRPERDGNRDGGYRDRERERQARFRAQEEALGPVESTEPRHEAAEASFLRQPLFPVLVAEPEDDMIAGGPALVETPEDRADRAPPAREGRGRRPRRAVAEGVEAPAPAPVDAAPAVAPAGEEAPARKPRRPRKPRADAEAGAPDVPSSEG